MTLDTDVLDTTRASRRTIVRGAAWTVPVIAAATAAPAFAASCDTAAYRLNWGTTTYTKNNATAGTARVSGAVGSHPVVVTFASQMRGSMVAADDNITVDTGTTDIGNLGNAEVGLLMSHANPIPAGRDNRQTLTISFDRDVTGLSFTITDIDSAGSGTWYDQVEASGNPTFAVTPRPAWQGGTYVVGNGSNGNAWRYRDDNTNLANSGSDRGNVTLTYSGAVRSITLDYWSSYGGSNQKVWISDLTFNAKGCIQP